MALDVSVCVAVYKGHEAPNLVSLADALPAALGGLQGELVVALNGISAADAGVPTDARTVPLPENLGIAPAWNAAGQAATAPILVFANDDVLPGPRTLERLTAALHEQPDAGVVGPVGSTWDRATWRHVDFVDPSNEIVACDVVSGFLFATPRDLWQRVGRFDEAYAPASWEEVDYNCAVQRLGLRSYAVGGLHVQHDWGISARQPPWRTIRWGGRRELLWSVHRRNRRHFLSKWSKPST